MSQQNTQVYRWNGSAWTRPGTSGPTNPPPATVPHAAAFSSNQPFSNFVVDYGGITVGVTPGNTLAGAGQTVTGYYMVANTSTHAADVPAQSTGSTNPLYLMALQGSSAAPLTGVEWHDFALIGTTQGHLYNGIRWRDMTAPWLHDVYIRGIPGNAGSPPGETFSMNFYKCTSAKADRVTIDALDDTGAAVAASLFGLNNVTGFTGTNLIANNASGTGIGFTSWQSSGVNLTDCNLKNNRVPLNYEQCSGTSTLTRVDLRGAGSGTTAPAHIFLDGNLASVQLTVVDPILDAYPLKVRTKTTYAGLATAQNTSDIKLIVGGIDRSGDTNYLRTGPTP